MTRCMQDLGAKATVYSRTPQPGGSAAQCPGTPLIVAEDPDSRSSPCPLRATVFPSECPGPVVQLEGGLVGFEAFYEVRGLVRRVFDQYGEPLPVAFDLCTIQTADPPCLDMLGSTLANAHRRGRHFRVLLPPGYAAEFLVPRLVAWCTPYRVRRITEYDAIAFDS